MHATKYLDEFSRHRLVQQLGELASLACRAHELMAPSSSPGDGSGVRSAPRSRPPVQLAVLDAFDYAEQVVGGWCRALAEDAGVDKPRPLDLRVRARHLAREVHTLALCEWAPDAAEEIAGALRVLEHVCNGGGSYEEVEPLASPRSAALWSRRHGVMVSERTVQRWARTGVLASAETVTGSILVDPVEVHAVAVARGRGGRRVDDAAAGQQVTP